MRDFRSGTIPPKRYVDEAESLCDGGIGDGRDGIERRHGLFGEHHARVGIWWRRGWGGSRIIAIMFGGGNGGGSGRSHIVLLDAR